MLKVVKIWLCNENRLSSHCNACNHRRCFPGNLLHGAGRRVSIGGNDTVDHTIRQADISGAIKEGPLSSLNLGFPA